jgi:putative transposase
MNLVYKFQIWPTKHQQTLIKKQLEAHKELYNLALLEKEKQYKETKKSDSCFTQIKKHVPLVKKTENGQLCNYSSLQQTIRRLHNNYKKVYKRKGGKPRAKKALKSIAYGKQGDGWKLIGENLYIQNVGLVKINLHRRTNGTVQSLIIKRDNEKFYACFACDEIPSNITLPTAKIGIDFGLKTFLTTSSGDSIEHPQPLKKSLKKLKKITRQIKKAQNLQIKAKKQKARRKLHNRIANQRKDFAHKLSRKIVNENKVIAVEDLNLKWLVQDKVSNINRKYLDVGVGLFYGYLAYKAESAGRLFVAVDPKNTSRICNKCKKEHDMPVKKRKMTCGCGNAENRDLNAAKNILELGLKTVGLYSLASA